RDDHEGRFCTRIATARFTGPGWRLTMRFVAIFDDSTEMAEVRNRLEPDHLRYLETHHTEIPMAGGLRNKHGGSYVGGLWVFEVANRTRAVE
ncbi:MAG: YciI family protein, partial [Betaproteobacteria bacterium]